MVLRLRRLGFFGRRVFLVAAVVLVAAGGTFLLAPLRNGAAELQLVALGGDGHFGSDVTLGSVADDSAAIPAFPLVLGIRNAGAGSVRPTGVELTLPARFQLRSGSRLLAGTRGAGETLVLYRVDGDFLTVEPDRFPVLLPDLDSLWLEPVLPVWECLAVVDSVPELVPARLPDPALMTEVPIFWSIDGEGSPARQSGLLRVRIDPQRLARAVPPEPARGPVERRPRGFEIPDTVRTGLEPVGSHTVACGPPERPMELHVTGWRTAEGGWLLRLDWGGTPRKYLLDRDGDGTVERELWDPDGDGRFEAARNTSLPLPGFLLPPLPPQPDSAAIDSLGAAVPDTGAVPTADSVAPPRPVAAPPPDTAARVADTAAPPPAPARRDTAPRPPADTTPPPRDTTPPPPADTVRPPPRDTTPPPPADTVRPPPRDTVPPDTTPPSPRGAGVAAPRQDSNPREPHDG